MDDPKEKIADLFDKLKTQINLQLELVSLNIGEKTAQLLAKLVSSGAITFFAVFVFLFANFAVAFALSSCFKSYALGFLFVAVFYSVVALIIVICKNKYIEKPLIDFFIRMFFDKNSEGGTGA